MFINVDPVHLSKERDIMSVLEPRRELKWKSPVDLKLEEIVEKSPRYGCKFLLVRNARRVVRRFSESYDRAYFDQKVSYLKQLYNKEFEKYLAQYRSQSHKKHITMPLTVYDEMNDAALNVIYRHARRYGGYEPENSQLVIPAGSFED